MAFQCKFFLDGNHMTSKDIDAFAGSLSKFIKSSKHKNITFIDGRKLAKLITNIL